MHQGRFLILGLVLAGAAIWSFSQVPSPDDCAGVLKAFRDVPAEFRSAPLWIWNDRVTKTAIDSPMADFKAQGIGGVFIHPRPGLITPYLSDEWLSLCRHAVETGKMLGLKVWLYDENSYSSGFAGGHVPAAMPDAVRSGLRLRTVEEIPEAGEPPLLVLKRTTSGGYEVVTAAEARQAGKGEYHLFDVKRSTPSSWHGGFTYVDLMRRDVTDKFLQVTLDAYKSVLGDEFGRAVPGVFQDEAEIAPAGGAEAVNYTPALFEAFAKTWGYDLRPNLLSLFQEVGDWRRIRHNYYATLLDLFIANWAEPYYRYCTDNKLLLTGHYWDHEWPRPRVAPDSMALSAFAHVPGIDILENQWQSRPSAQFGNARSVKEVRSMANQMGRRRVLSETYGASGWDLSFFDQKRIVDWECALGVNLVNQHLSYMSIKGARKRDHPPSFSAHEPWWPAYKLMGDYIGRLSVALSSGRQENRILVVEPTTTAWMYYAPDERNASFEEVGYAFQDFVHRLEASQVEYDLASERTVRGHGRVLGARLYVGQCAYDLIVLPQGMENLNSATAALLEGYLQQGGRIVSFVDPPLFRDGQRDVRFRQEALKYAERWVSANVEEGIPALVRKGGQDLAFRSKGQHPEWLFHHRRRLKDGQLVFLANVSPADSAAGRFVVTGDFIEKWDLFTGRVTSYPSEPASGKVAVSFDLPAGGSLLLCVRKGRAPAHPAEVVFSGRKGIPAEAAVTAVRESPNVLTLDYCDLLLAGREHKDLYFYEAQTKVYAAHGFARNPWDNAVQYKTGILDRNIFGPDSGFEAVYWFDVAEGVRTQTLQAVVEQAELYQVSVNGQVVTPAGEDWWLDKAFRILEIGNYVRPGMNSLTLKAAPFTVFTELEPVYIRGDFALESRDKGFQIVPAAGLGLGPWREQGMPFYAGGVRYDQVFAVPPFNPKKNRLLVKLGRWQGAVAEVFVDGRSRGHIAFPPYELDVTESLLPIRHRISVVVYGMLKNTLGPHHGDPPRGAAWPGHFQKAAPGGRPAGTNYDLRDFGLMVDFSLHLAWVDIEE